MLPCSPCWPLDVMLYAVVRSSYTSLTSGQNCIQAHAMLSFLSHLYQSPSVPVITSRLGVVSMQHVPQVNQRALSALQSITCDGDTILLVTARNWTLASGITGFGWAMSILMLLLCTITGALLFQYRRHPVLKSSTVMMLVSIILGLAIMSIACILLTSASYTASTCQSIYWCTALGFTLVFGSLFLKTWRVNAIFKATKLKVVKISDRKLQVLLLAALLVDVLLLSIWTAVASSPSDWAYVTAIVNGLHEVDYAFCTISKSGMPIALTLLVFKGGLILCTCISLRVLS
jgi:hypothetical protein